jgi:[ribosomal protein S18]-alanine N-acetyltransferase
MKYLIRNANIGDIISIMNIEEECFDVDTQEDSDLYLRRIMAFPEGCFVIKTAGKEGGIVGCFFSELWSLPENLTSETFEENNTNLWKHNPAGKDLYISSIAILPEFRGKGAGKTLFIDSLKTILKSHKQIENLILIVSEDYTAARRLYTRSGFTELLIIDDFFGGTETPPRKGVVKIANRINFDILNTD